MDTPTELSTKIAESAGHVKAKFPLHDALKRQDYQTIYSLLETGVKATDLIIKNSDGKTVIDLAGELNTDKGKLLFRHLQTLCDMAKHDTTEKEAPTSSREMDEKGVHESQCVDLTERLPSAGFAWRKRLDAMSGANMGETASLPFMEEIRPTLDPIKFPDDSLKPSACSSSSMLPSHSPTTFPKQLEQLEQITQSTYRITDGITQRISWSVSKMVPQKELNTRLHDAVTQGNVNLVSFFLHKGADINSRNLSGHTALEAARNLNTNEGRAIIQLLERRSRKLQYKSDVVTLHEPNFTPFLPSHVREKTILCEEQGKSTSEQLYLTKLSSLVFLRASTNEVLDNFVLGANINDITAFKDLCVRYKQDKEDAVIFLKVIYKCDRSVEKISRKELWATDSNLSIINYFNSYIKIRNKFYDYNTDLIFDGRYEDLKRYLILYTNLKDDFGERKCIIDFKLGTNKTVKDLLSTNDEIANIFQYKYDEWDIDCLTKTLLKERFESIAKSLLKLVGAHNIKIMDYNIKIYHILLAKKVIETAHSNVGTFRSEFLTSNDESLIELRKALYRQVVKEKLQNDKINEAIRLILFQPNVCTISKLIGNVIEYNHQSKQLEVVRPARHLVDQKLRNSLSEVQVSRTTARRAMETAGIEKLKNIRLKLPEGFGKFTFNIKGANVKKSYNQFAAKLEVMINGSTSKHIIIDETVVGPNKILEPGDMAINSCIGTALTDLLVLDEDSKSFMFNMNGSTLEPNAQKMLDELQSRIEDLESCRLQVNLPGYPKLSFGADASEKGLAKDFLDNLWFFTGQADVDNIDKIAVKEILDRKVSLPENV